MDNPYPLQKNRLILVKNNKTNVRIDYKVSGIGSNSCGPQLMEKYWLGKGKFIFSFFIK